MLPTAPVVAVAAEIDPSEDLPSLWELLLEIAVVVVRQTVKALAAAAAGLVVVVALEQHSVVVLVVDFPVVVVEEEHGRAPRRDLLERVLAVAL